MFDVKNLTQLKKLGEYARGPMKAFWTFDKDDRGKKSFGAVNLERD